MIGLSRPDLTREGGKDARVNQKAQSEDEHKSATKMGGGLTETTKPGMTEETVYKKKKRRKRRSKRTGTAKKKKKKKKC